MVAGSGAGGEKWRELSRRSILSNPVFTVTERESEGPDGRVGRFSVIEARDWATVVPLVRRGGEDFFLMVRQYRHGLEDVSVEFPGGVIEEGEDPARAAARELLEETGCRADRLVHAGSLSPNPAIMANTFHVYVAFGLEKAQDQDLDEQEIVDALEVPAALVRARMGEPPYSHALMACALLLAERVMGQAD